MRSPAPASPRRRRPRGALTLALATAALALPSCGLFGGNSIVLLGDSLTVLVHERFAADTDGTYDVKMSATWGLRIDEELDVAARVAADDPDQVVVNLGTNNVLQRYDSVASAEDLDTLVGQLSDVRCVHIVTVNEHISRLGEDYTAESTALNEAIRTVAARRLNTHVIDWNAILTERGTADLISEDGVHPNPAGVAALSAAYRDAVDDC